MARDESEREDLLREATALVERIELETHAGVTIIAGFRANGALSIFFGEDSVYQFNASGELRRAYSGGLLYKSVGSELVSLNRTRTATEVQLVRRSLSGDEQKKFLAVMQHRLHTLQTAIEAKQLTAIGQVPPHADVLGRVHQWLQNCPSNQIAQKPNA